MSVLLGEMFRFIFTGSHTGDFAECAVKRFRILITHMLLNHTYRHFGCNKQSAGFLNLKSSVSAEEVSAFFDWTEEILNTYVK